jgi:hypothetical protein
MRVILTGFMILAIAGVAQATVTLTAVEVAITAGAIANDPALTGAVCYNVQATSTADLIGFSITDIVYDGGGLYQHANGVAKDLGPPDPVLVGFLPALGYDSYVDMPMSPPVAPPGATEDLNSPPGSSFDYADFTVVGDPEHGAQTNYVIAQITIKAPVATGTLYITSAEYDGTVDGDLVQHTVPLPEPATMSLLALGGLVALRRRR